MSIFIDLDKTKSSKMELFIKKPIGNENVLIQTYFFSNTFLAVISK